MQLTRRVVAVVLSVCVFAIGNMAGMAQERRIVTVRSQDFGYYYYRVNTGNRVSLTRQLSRTECEYNRTWGYDYRGVWVDRGCEAEFEVGGGSGAPILGSTTGTSSDGRREIYVYSPNYRYYKYSITTGNEVEMVRQISNAPCDKDRTWGFDGNGVWVDQGCSGEFLVGKRPSGSNAGGGSNAGRNAAIFGALTGGLVLAAILSSKADNDKHKDEVPDWMIGTFRGYNPAYDSTVELTIYSGGSVSIRRPGMQSVTGVYRNSQIEVDDLKFKVTKQGNGFRTSQVGNENNQVSYVRIY